MSSDEEKGKASEEPEIDAQGDENEEPGVGRAEQADGDEKATKAPEDKSGSTDDDPAEEEEQAEEKPAEEEPAEEEPAEEEEQAADTDESDGDDGPDRVESILPTPIKQLPTLVAAATQAAEKWAATSLIERIEAIAQVKQRILSRAEEIAELLQREVGKPIEEAVLAEVLPNADLVDYWCDSIEELLEGTHVDLDPLSYPGKQGRIHRDPRGVVALITPYNFPIAIALRTLLPALLSGNAVIFKPSEHTQLCGRLVASLFAGLLPEGLLQLVQGGADVGKALAASDVQSVVFTGGVDAGRAVAVACALNLVPCSLELGGKDAAIVLEDCRLERAAQGVVWGAFNNAGQNCASIERVYVVDKVADEFIKRVVEITKTLGASDLAQLTTSTQHRKVCSQLDDAIDGGAKVLVGGKPETDGLAFAPTVLRVDEAGSDSALMQQETFGPLLAIMVVADEKEAIERVNDSALALTTSIWTKRVRHAHDLARQLRSGVVTVNNHGFTAALPAAPWTGAGDSGHGVTNSPHCLHSFTRVRFVLEDRSRASRELWWYPYTPVLRTLVFAMAIVRGGGSFLQRIAALFRLIPALFKRLLLGG